MIQLRGSKLSFLCYTLAMNKPSNRTRPCGHRNGRVLSWWEIIQDVEITSCEQCVEKLHYMKMLFFWESIFLLVRISIRAIPKRFMYSFNADRLVFQKNIMAVIALCVTFWVIISTAFTAPCDVTDLVNSQAKANTYFSWEQNNSCYIFALKKASFRDATVQCRRIGGHLTDIENVTTLQTYINTELRLYTGDYNSYWIGLARDDNKDDWYWQTSAIVAADLKQSIKTCSSWFCSYDCVYMKLNTLESCCCSDKNPFICKLNLGCQQDSDNKNDSCSRCRAFINEYKTTTATMTTPTPTTDDNTTVTIPNPNTTINVYNKSSVDGQCDQCDCKMHLGWIDNNTTVILVVLGGLAAVLLITVFAMTATIFKYRRLLNSEERTKRISLVDILNVDSTETRKNRRNEQAGSHPGSTTELLYTSVDATYALPDKDDGRKAEESESTYQNQRSLQGEERDSSTLPVSLSYASPSSDLGNNLASGAYSHLNHNGETLIAGSQNTYGMASASAPIDLPSGKSPTYESYM